MFSAFVNPRMSHIRSLVIDPTEGQRGRQYGSFTQFYSQQPLPTDPIDTVDIAFYGVFTGSEIKIFDIDKVLLDGTETSGTIPTFTLSRYAPGSAYNTVRILIINLGYEVLDVTYELPTNDSTIPVFQRIDRNYRNP